MTRYRPGPPLDRFVDCFWLSRRDVPLRGREFMLPSGQAQMVLALQDATYQCSASPSAPPLLWSRGVVHGPQWQYYVAGPKEAGTCIGVSFRPGAAGVLLGIPASELAGLHVPLDALWGSRVGSLRERLVAARSPDAAFKVLEVELVARIQRPLLMHPVVAQGLASAIASRHAYRVAQIQRESGYSARHFIALFRGAVGITPKHFYRLQRFNEAARQIASGSDVLAGIAATLGYADQAHMTREFRELAGVAPRRYRPASPDSPLHHRDQK